MTKVTRLAILSVIFPFAALSLCACFVFVANYLREFTRLWAEKLIIITLDWKAGILWYLFIK